MNKQDYLEKSMESARLLKDEKHKEEIEEFIDSNSPESIEEELNKYVIGQPQLTRMVADFAFYHALKQRHPELPPRVILTSGPSGSGKTEVWRTLSKMPFGKIFKIEIADSSKITSEGWSGGYKINSFLSKDMADGIIIFDEFDKLARPRHSSTNENVSLSLQSEFLRLMEGDFVLKDAHRPLKNFETAQMSIALVGAFEDIRNNKLESANTKTIGFNSTEPTVKIDHKVSPRDLIDYGVMPELVGRISEICTTNFLDDAEYLKIIKSPTSRVGNITKVLQGYGVSFDEVVSDSDILRLIKNSKENSTGVRWVSAQVESKLLKAMRKVDFSHDNFYTAKNEKSLFC